ncbi:MAG: periplasmic heavy metal sensor [Pseudomonadota bacterium]
MNYLKLAAAAVLVCATLPALAQPPAPNEHLAMHAADLSDAQQDKLFAIMHAAEPLRRELGKAERQAHDALRALGAAPQFDEQKAAALAQVLGQAVAASALQQARIEAQTQALLTPEQRLQRGQQRPPHPPRAQQ